jgi:hypothetical protein
MSKASDPSLGVHRVVLRPNLEIRWNIHTVERDGYEWECWQVASWHWHWCWPWYYKIYYDGWHYSLHCGIGSWCFDWDTNYAQRRKIGA